MRSKVAAAMERAEALEAQLESQEAEHVKQHAAVTSRCTGLEEQLKKAEKAAEDVTAQCHAAEAKAERYSVQKPERQSGMRCSLCI